MYLINPEGGKRKYTICLRIHDGSVRKFPGHRDRKIARDVGMKIEMLVTSKVNGDKPPLTLNSWIQNMPDRLATRLMFFGLLDRHRVEQKLSIEEHIIAFRESIQARSLRDQNHPKNAAQRVRRVFDCIGGKRFGDLTKDNLRKAVASFTVKTGLRKGLALSQRYRREYIFTIKQFCYWMIENKRALSNPVEFVEAPGAYEDPVVNRRPFELSEFQRLMEYLSKAKNYPQQKSKWFPNDRAMCYLTAVKTGFRLSELRSLTRESLDLDSSQATVTIKACDAKNKTQWTVPISKDLAAALRDYVAQRPMGAPLFPMPKGRFVVKTLYKDLDAAGVKRVFDNGDRRDFHTFRTTAITWLMTVDRLSLKEVQQMARLKTLALVEKYSRNFKMCDFAFLDRSPILRILPDSDKKAS